MKILILGGTGAMGVALNTVLEEQGYEVYITSRRYFDSYGKVHYLQGNAHDDNFMSEVLKNKYDVIIDFMTYGSEEFKHKVVPLLNATGQYFFTSSSRVYADSDKPITEHTPRLLDVCKDVIYLGTDEYALAKAREEDILFCCGKKNWTIIRPYITYNTERLQLGAIEKDIWLFRAMHGRSIPLPKDVASHQTTMTYGGDVALAIAALIGNGRALQEAINLVGTDHMTWAEVSDIYLDVIREQVGEKLHVNMELDGLKLAHVMNNTAQVEYDRLYDRIFDNSKLQAIIGGDISVTFTHMSEGLALCLQEFIKKPHWMGGLPNYKIEAYLNKYTAEKMSPPELKSLKDKIKYFGWRHTPSVMNYAKRLHTQVK